MCFKCYDKIEDKKCPLCKENIQASDRTVREVGQSFRYKCLNDGCNSIFTYDDITEHHRTCPHDPDKIRSGRALEIQELREQMIQEPVDRNRPDQVSSIVPHHGIRFFTHPSPVSSVKRRLSTIERGRGRSSLELQQDIGSVSRFVRGQPDPQEADYPRVS